MGVEAENLIETSDNLKESDIFQYFYPDDYELNKNGTRGIYLEITLDGMLKTARINDKII